MAVTGVGGRPLSRDRVWPPPPHEPQEELRLLPALVLEIALPARQWRPKLATSAASGDLLSFGALAGNQAV